MEEKINKLSSSLYDTIEKRVVASVHSDVRMDSLRESEIAYLIKQLTGIVEDEVKLRHEKLLRNLGIKQAKITAYEKIIGCSNFEPIARSAKNLGVIE